MKRLLLLILFTPALSHAQTSIGFRNPKDMNELLQYQLPDWTYTQWRIDGEYLGYGNTFEGDLVSFEESQTQAMLSPRFAWYWENDDRVMALNFYWQSSYNREIQDSDYIEKETVKQIHHQFRALWKRRQYFSPLFFGFGEGAVAGWIQNTDGDALQLANLHLSDSDGFTSDLSIGIGFGRIRNVTPILRALRVGERLHALGRSELTSSQIQRMARHFAQKGGYDFRYDRPEKSCRKNSPIHKNTPIRKRVAVRYSRACGQKT